MTERYLERIMAERYLECIMAVRYLECIMAKIQSILGLKNTYSTMRMSFLRVLLYIFRLHSN